MMQVTSCMEDQDGGTVVKRLSVPVGLEELMTGLTKEVLQKKPRDIYSFASDHFAQLLALRDNGNYQQAPSKSITYASRESVENLLASGKVQPSKSSNGTPTKLSRQVSIRAASPPRHSGPKIKRSSTPKYESNNNNEGKIKDKQDKKKPVLNRQQTPGSKGKFDSLEPVKEDVLKMVTKRQSLSRRSTDKKSKADSENSRDSKRSSSEESEKRKRPSRDVSLKKKSTQKKVQSGDSKEFKDKKNGQEKLKGGKEETKKKSFEDAAKAEKVRETPTLGLQHSGEIHDVVIPKEITDDSFKEQSKDKNEDVKNEQPDKFIVKSSSIEESTTGIKDGRLTVTPPKILKEVQTSSDDFDLLPTLIVPVLTAVTTSLNGQKSPDQSTSTTEQCDESKTEEDSETGEIVSSLNDEDENKDVSSKTYDPSALREELQKVEEESKLNNFTSSYNPYKLKQEIRNASKDIAGEEEEEEGSSARPSADSEGFGEIPKPSPGDKENDANNTTKGKEPNDAEENGIEEAHVKENSHGKGKEQTLQKLNVPGQPENNKLQLLHEQTAVSEGSTTGSIEGSSLENKEMPEEDTVEENKLKKSLTISSATDEESAVVLRSTSGLQHSGELHDQMIPKDSDDDKNASSENNKLEKSSTTIETTPIVLESISGLRHSGELHDQLIPKESGQHKNASAEENELYESTSVPKTESPDALRSTSGLQHSGELHDQLIPKETDDDKSTSDLKNVAETKEPREASSVGLRHSGELHDQLIPKEICEENTQKTPTLSLQHSGELHDTLIPKQTNVEDENGKHRSFDFKEVGEPQNDEIPETNPEMVEDDKDLGKSLEGPNNIIAEKGKYLVEDAENELKTRAVEKPSQETNETAAKLTIGETIEQAATKIQAGVRGYLTRKLNKTKTPGSVVSKTIPNKLSDEELQEVLTQLDSIPVPSESPHASRHKREATPVDLIDIKMENATGQKDKLSRSKTVHAIESEKSLIPNLFKSLSVTDSALSKTLDDDDEKMRDSTEDSVSLEHTEDLGIESEKSVMLHSDTTIKNVEEEKVSEASTASLENSGDVALIPKESETDRKKIEGKTDLEGGTEKEHLQVRKNGKPVQEVEITPKESVPALKEESMSPKLHQLASTAGLQHSGELHDILIPKEVEEASQNVKILEIESLQHNGESPDFLLAKETEESQQKENVENLKVQEFSQKEKDEKTLEADSLQHSGELHDILTPQEASKEIQDDKKLLNNNLLHSGEVHDLLIVPKETEEIQQKDLETRKELEQPLQEGREENKLESGNLQHSAELHDITLPKDVSSELEDAKNLVKDNLHHTGELHELVVPTETEGISQVIQDDKKFAKNSLQHSGELHDLLIPEDVEKTLQDVKDVKNLAIEDIQASGKVSEEISQELQDDKTMTKDALQHSGELHDVLIPKDVVNTAQVLQHSGEVHDLLIPKEIQETLQEEKDLKNVLTEGIQGSGNQSEEITRELQDDKILITDAVQRSNELLNVRISNEVEKPTQELQEDHETKENLQHSGELHDLLIPKEVRETLQEAEVLTAKGIQVNSQLLEKISQELQEDKTLIKDALQHSGELHDVLIPNEADNTAQELQNDDEVKEKLPHSGELHDLLIPKEVEETLQEADDLTVKGIQASGQLSEKISDELQEDKTLIKDALQHSGELHDVLIPKEAENTDQELQNDDEAKENLQHSGELHDLLIPKEVEETLQEADDLTVKGIQASGQLSEKISEELQEDKTLIKDALQHSGELHDVLIPKEAENTDQELQNDDEAKENLQHSGELHDLLIPKEVEETLQEADDLTVKGIQASGQLSEKIYEELQEDKTLIKDALQHSGELHDVLIPKEAENTDQELQNDDEAKENLQHSGELHDLLIPKEVEETLQEADDLTVKGIQASGQLSEKISEELQEDKTLIKDALHHSGELHDVLIPKEAENTDQELQNDDEAKENLQHSGELHDLLIPKEVEETLQEVNDLTVKGIQASGQLSEKISEELQENKALIKDALQHSGELHDVLIPKEAENTDKELQNDGEVKENLPHSGELHDLLIPKEVEETLQEAEDLTVKDIQASGQLSDKISEELQEDKTLIKHALQHSGELHDVLIPKEAENTAQELQNDNEAKENLQHSGELHDLLIPKEVEETLNQADDLTVKGIQASGQLSDKISEELQDDKTLIKDALQHSAELHDVSIPKEAEKPVNELQDDDQAKENIQHNGELHDLLIPQQIEETFQEAKAVKNLATEGIQASGKFVEDISQLQDHKTLIDDALQHSGELHDVLIPKEADTAVCELQGVDKAKESLQHSGELHDSLILQEIENVSQKLQDGGMQSKTNDIQEKVEDDLVVGVQHIDNPLLEKSAVEGGVEGETTAGDKSTKPSINDQHEDANKKSTDENANKADDVIKQSPSFKDQVGQNGSKDPTKQESGLTSMSGLQHSGELHDLLIPQNEVLSKSQVEEENVQVEEKIKPSSAGTTSAASRKDSPKLASRDGFQHSGEMHDILIPQENLNITDINDQSFTDSPEMVVKDNQKFQDGHKTEESLAGQCDVTVTSSGGHFSSLVLDEQASATSFEKDLNLQETVGLQHTGGHDILIAGQTKKDFQDEGTKDDSKPLALNQVQNVEVAKVEYSGNENSLNQPCTTSVLAKSSELEEEEAVTSATPSFDPQHYILPTSSETEHKTPSLKEAQKEIVESADTSTATIPQPLHHELKTDSLISENAQVVEQTPTCTQELPASKDTNTDTPASNESAEDDKVVLVKNDSQEAESKESGKNTKPQEAATAENKKVFCASKLHAELQEVGKQIEESKDKLLVAADDKIVEIKRLNEAEKMPDEEKGNNAKKNEQESVDDSTTAVVNNDISEIEGQILQEAEINNVSEERFRHHEILDPSKVNAKLDAERQANDNKNEVIIDMKDAPGNEKAEDKAQEASEKWKDQEVKDIKIGEVKSETDFHERKNENQEDERKVIDEDADVEAQTQEGAPITIEEEKDKNKVSGKNSIEDINHSNKAVDTPKLHAEVEEVRKEEMEEGTTIEDIPQETNNKISQEVEETSLPVETKIINPLQEKQNDNVAEDAPLEDVNDLKKPFNISKLQAEIQEAAKQECKEEAGDATEITNKIPQDVKKMANKEHAKTAKIGEGEEDQKDDVPLEDAADTQGSFDISKLRVELADAGNKTEKDKTELIIDDSDVLDKNSSSDQMIDKKPKHIKEQLEEENGNKEIGQHAFHASQKDDIQEENLQEDVSNSNKRFDIAKLRLELEEGAKVKEDKLELTERGTEEGNTEEEKPDKDLYENENIVQKTNISEGAVNPNKKFDISELRAELEATEKEIDNDVEKIADEQSTESAKLTLINTGEKDTVHSDTDQDSTPEEEPSEFVAGVNTSFDISKLRAELEVAGKEQENTDTSKIANEHDEVGVHETVAEKRMQSLSSKPTEVEKKIVVANTELEENQDAVDEKKKDMLSEQVLSANIKEKPELEGARIHQGDVKTDPETYNEVVKMGSSGASNKEEKEDLDNIQNMQTEQAGRETEKIKFPSNEEATKENENIKNETKTISEKESLQDATTVKTILQESEGKVLEEKPHDDINQSKTFDISKLRSELEKAGKQAEEDKFEPSTDRVLISEKIQPDTKEGYEEQTLLNDGVEELAKPKSADHPKPITLIMDDKNKLASKDENDKEQTPLNERVEESSKRESVDHPESKPLITDNKNYRESKGGNEKEENKEQTHLNEDMKESTNRKLAAYPESEIIIADDISKQEYEQVNKEQTQLKEVVKESTKLESPDHPESETLIADNKNKQESKEVNEKYENKVKTQLHEDVKQSVKPEPEKTVIIDDTGRQSNQERTPLNRDMEESVDHPELKTLIMDDKSKQENNAPEVQNIPSEEKKASEKNQVINMPKSDLGSTTVARNNVLTPIQSADQNSQNNLPDESPANVYESAPTRPVTSDITPNIIPNENIQIPSETLHKQVQDIEQIIKPDIESDENLALEVNNGNKDTVIEKIVEMKQITKSESAVKENNESKENNEGKEEGKMEKSPKKEIMPSNKNLSEESLNEEDIKIKAEEDGERPVSIASTTSTDSVATVITVSPQERNNDRKDSLSRSLSNSSEKSEDSNTDTQIEDKTSNVHASVPIKHETKNRENETEEGNEKQERGGKREDTKDATVHIFDMSKLQAEIEVAEEADTKSPQNQAIENLSNKDHGDENFSKHLKDNTAYETNYEKTPTIENERLMETTEEKGPRIEDKQLRRRGSSKSPERSSKDLNAQVIDAKHDTSGLKMEDTFLAGMLKNDDNLDNYNFQQNQESPEVFRHAAAATIQSNYRGYRVRRDLGNCSLSTSREESGTFDSRLTEKQSKVDPADVNEHIKDILLQHVLNEDTDEILPEIVSTSEKVSPSENSHISSNGNVQPLTINVEKNKDQEDPKIMNALVSNEQLANNVSSAKSNDSTISNETPVDLQELEIIEGIKTQKTSSGSAKSRDSTINEAPVDLEKSNIVEDVTTEENSSGKQSAKSRDSAASSETPVDLHESETIDGVKTEETSSGKQSAKSRDSTISNEAAVDLEILNIIDDVKTEKTSSGKQSAKSRDSAASSEVPVDLNESEIIENVKTEDTSSGEQSAKSRDSTISNEAPVDLEKSNIIDDVRTEKPSSGKQSAKSRDSAVSREASVDLHESEIIEDVKTEETSSRKQSAKHPDSIPSNVGIVELSMPKKVESTRSEGTFLGQQPTEVHDTMSAKEDEGNEKKSMVSKQTTTVTTLPEAKDKKPGKVQEENSEADEDTNVEITPHVIATAPPLHLLDHDDDYDFSTQLSENSFHNDVAVTIDHYKNATAPPVTLFEDTEKHLTAVAKSREQLLLSPAEKDFQSSAVEISSPVEAIKGIAVIGHGLLSSKKIDEKVQQSSTSKIESQEDHSKSPNSSEKTEGILTNIPRNLDGRNAPEKLQYENTETKNVDHAITPTSHNGPAGAVPKALDVVLDQQLAIAAPNAGERQDSIESEDPDYIYIPLKQPLASSASAETSTFGLQHSGEFHDTVGIPLLNLKEEEKTNKDLSLEIKAAHEKESKTVNETIFFDPADDFSSSKYDLVGSGVSPRAYREPDGAVPKALGVVLDQQLAITAPKAAEEQGNSKSEGPQYIHIPLRDSTDDSTSTETSNSIEASTSDFQHTGELHDTIAIPLLNLNQEEETHTGLNLAAKIDREKEFKAKHESITHSVTDDFTSSKYNLVESGVSPRPRKEEEGAIPKALGTILDQQLAITTPRAEDKRDGVKSEGPEYIYIPLKDSRELSSSAGLQHSGELHDIVAVPLLDETPKEETPAPQGKTTISAHEQKVDPASEGILDNLPEEWDSSKYDLTKGGKTPRIRKEQEGAVPKVLGTVLDQQLAITTPLGKPKKEKDESVDPEYIYIPLKNGNDLSTSEPDLKNGLRVDDPNKPLTSQAKTLTNEPEEKDSGKPSQEKEQTNKCQSEDSNKRSNSQENELSNGFQGKDTISPSQEKGLTKGIKGKHSDKIPQGSEQKVAQTTDMYKSFLSQEKDNSNTPSTSKVEQLLTNGHHPTNGFRQNGVQGNEEVNKTIIASLFENQSRKPEERQNEAAILNLPLDETVRSSSGDITVKDNSSSLSPASSNQYSLDMAIPPPAVVEEISVLGNKVKNLEMSKVEEPSLEKTSAAKLSSADIKHKNQIDHKTGLSELGTSPRILSKTIENSPTISPVPGQPFPNQLNDDTDSNSSVLILPTSSLSLDQQPQDLQIGETPSLGLHLRFSPSPTQNLEGRSKSISPSSETINISPTTDALISAREDRSIQSESPPIVIQSTQISDNTMPFAVQLNQAPGAAVLTSPTPNDDDDDDDAGEAMGAHAPGKVASTKVETPKNRAHFRTSMETGKRKNATIKEKNMEEVAATKIQASFRGYQVRKNLKLKNGGVESVRRSLRRKSSGKLRGSEKVSQKASSKPSALEEKSATKIQAGIRGFLVRRRQSKKPKNNTTPESF